MRVRVLAKAVHCRQGFRKFAMNRLPVIAASQAESGIANEFSRKIAMYHENFAIPEFTFFAFFFHRAVWDNADAKELFFSIRNQELVQPLQIF